MPKTSSPTAADLIAALAAKGHGDKEDMTAFLQAHTSAEDSPLYLRVLAGIGAFIASICFIAVLALADLIDYQDETTLVLWGLGFAASAVAIHKWAGQNANVFATQSSLAFMLVGKGLIVFAGGIMTNSGWGASLALLMVTAAVYPIYRVSLDRFLSTLVTVLSLIINGLWSSETEGYREILFNGAFLTQLGLVAIFLTWSKVHNGLLPIAYAFATSLCACIVFLATQANFGTWQYIEYISPTLITAALTISLIATIGWAAGGAEKLKTRPLAMATIGTIALGLVAAPGIVLSLCLMILGYARHDTPLKVMGILLMPLFIFLYYYNLDISLLQKSGVLFGSGIVLLSGRYFLQRQGWDHGGSPCAPN